MSAENDVSSTKTEFEKPKKKISAPFKIGIGVLLAAAAVTLIWLNTYSFFVYDAVIFAVSAAAAAEMAKAYGGLGYRVIKPPLALAVVAAFCAALLTGLFAPRSALFLGTLFFGILIAGFMAAGILYVLKPEITFKDFLATAATLIYPLFLLCAAYLVNRIGGGFLLLFAMIAALGTDAFAYFTGAAANKLSHGKMKKLIPRVSPNKTVAGAVGGVIGCLILITVYWLLIDFNGGVINIG
ncbi:MAG: phosphatidate cytidylyltransferase, partial [Clostridiales bacterium]|nr:phosphatidate cytidylyltransferase [Clostridiales bacterium]